MSETFKLAPQNGDQGDVQKPILALRASSSFEKIVSACTGAVITMSFSKSFIKSEINPLCLTDSIVNPLDVVKTRLQENSKNGNPQYKGTMVKKKK